MSKEAAKLTSKQQAILRVFEDAEQPITTQDAWDVARGEVPGLGIATVYRAVKSLVDDGLLRTVELVGQVPRYESARKGHLHHFFCRECSSVFDIGDCPSGLKSLVPDGFQMEDHSIVLYGLCKDCRAAKA
ncbi:MAG: Fur family transcriptional regulator [Sumerlaeia bacterium]